MSAIRCVTPKRAGAILINVVMALAPLRLARPAEDTPRESAVAGRIEREGLAIELSFQPVGAPSGQPVELMEGETVSVRFKITESATGAMVSKLRPAAWLSPRGASPGDCKEKIQAFIGGGLGARAEIDLNAYYVLALNNDPSISVVDPLFGYGGSKLLALVLLQSPGRDWVLTRNQNRLFVSMPAVNAVAVVDTTTWKVAADLDIGSSPGRLALQPDEKYLWVATPAGVAVVDVESTRLVAKIRTGAGPHEIAFSDDDRFVFVTNQKDSTLAIIDTRQLRVVKRLVTGRLPRSVAFSAIGNAVYVANEGDGTVAVVSARQHKIVARIKLAPGLRSIRFAPGGRLGFVANPPRNIVHIVDASTNRLVHTADIEQGPIEVSFTDTLAYVRSMGSEIIWMIPLSQVGHVEAINIVDFTGGQAPIGKAARLSLASTIVQAPEGNAVLVANPVDKMIYYYREGMAAPMGGFQNYGREPAAVLVVDRSIREVSPGLYSTSVKLPRSGTHDVAFFLDSPRILHCFEVAVKENPLLSKPKTARLKIEALGPDSEIRARATVRLRFRLSDPATGKPQAGLGDVEVLTLNSSAVWQKRRWAASVGDGVYEVDFEPPQEGIYYVFVRCPSLKLNYNQLPHRVLVVRPE